MGDLQTIMNIGKVVLVIAAITTTLFPTLYAFVPWWRSLLGRSMMAQSLALGLILDLSVVFQFFLTPSSRLVILWLNIGILAVIDPPVALQAISASAASHELPDAAGADS